MISDEYIENNIERSQMAAQVILKPEIWVDVLVSLQRARNALREISKYGEIGPGFVAREVLKLIDD